MPYTSARAATPTLEREVEAAQTVARERVRAALQHDRLRLVALHHLRDDLRMTARRRTHRLEDGDEIGVVDARAQGEVQRVALALAVADIRNIARAREEITELVEGHRHHAIRRVERLLHAVAVVNINVDVQHARIYSTLRMQLEQPT